MYPDEVIDILYSDLIISRLQRERLLAIKLTSDKSDELLDLIYRGTYGHLVAFKEALHKTHQSHLVKMLP